MKFGKGSFDIDVAGRTLPCPSGIVRAIVGSSVTFTGRSCPLECPHRCVCLGKSGKRIIKLRKHEALQQDAEKFAQTDRGKEMLFKRPTIERVIAQWMRNGARQARYFGRLKVWMQCVLSAIMCNVKKIANKVGNGGPNLLGFGPGVPLFRLAKMLIAIIAVISAIVGGESGFDEQRNGAAYPVAGAFKKALSSGGS